MNTIKLTIAGFTMIASVILFAAQAQAHDTWMTMDTYQAAENEAPGYQVYNSHKFPASAEDAMALDRLDSVFFITPSAKRMSGKKSFAETGTMLAVAVPVNGFATKTPDGYQRGKNRKEVDAPILCRNSMKFAKAVFTVGKAGGKAYATPLGQAMEMIPLKDPATLKAGDILPVQVLKNGKPVRTIVFGTYEGFSKEANTFGYATRTDKKGIAKITLIHDGAWLLIAKLEEPYPDPAVCDLQRWSSSLTFHIN